MLASWSQMVTKQWLVELVSMCSPPCSRHRAGSAFAVNRLMVASLVLALVAIALRQLPRLGFSSAGAAGDALLPGQHRHAVRRGAPGWRRPPAVPRGGRRAAGVAAGWAGACVGCAP